MYLDQSFIHEKGMGRTGSNFAEFRMKGVEDILPPNNLAPSPEKA